MNKLLLSVLTLTLSGCLSVFDSDVIVSMKNDVPCFSYADADWTNRKKIYIDRLNISEIEAPEEMRQRATLSFSVGSVRLLSPDQCIPYAGEEELKKDTLYLVDISPYVEGGAPDYYGFAATFYMTEGKNGETIVHQYDRKERRTVQGDATVSMKNSVPCFSYADVEGIPRNNIHIETVAVMNASENSRVMWNRQDDIVLPSPDQCIPYAGEEELKKDVVYTLWLRPYVKKGGNASYDFSVAFCLTEDKDGETVVHQYKWEGHPATCPASGAK